MIWMYVCIVVLATKCKASFRHIHVCKNSHHCCVLLDDVERNGGNSAINCNASATFNYNLI